MHFIQSQSVRPSAPSEFLSVELSKPCEVAAEEAVTKEDRQTVEISV